MSDIITIYKNKSKINKFIINEFNKPLHLNLCFQNRDVLLYNAKNIEFDNVLWDMNPQLFCEDTYSNFELYRLIMVVNNISSIFMFRPHYMVNNKIITPLIGTINSIFK